MGGGGIIIVFFINLIIDFYYKVLGKIGWFFRNWEKEGNFKNLYIFKKAKKTIQRLKGAIVNRAGI